MKPEDGAARVNMGCELRQPGRRVESVWAVIKGAVNLPAPSKVAWPDPARDHSASHFCFGRCRLVRVRPARGRPKQMFGAE
jgi:hypothetical protein